MTSEAKIYLHLVAGCCIGYKRHPLHVKERDVSQIKNSNCTSNKSFPKMVSIILDLLIVLMYVQVLVVQECVAIKWGCGVMIVRLQLGLLEFGRDFDTVAPPRNHYCTDLGSKWRLWYTMTAAILGCLASFFYSGRKWRHIIVFFYSLLFTQKTVQTECS